MVGAGGGEEEEEGETEREDGEEEAMVVAVVSLDSIFRCVTACARYKKRVKTKTGGRIERMERFVWPNKQANTGTFIVVKHEKMWGRNDVTKEINDAK